LFSLLIANGAAAQELPKHLYQDSDQIKLYKRYQKLQKQLVESEKDLGKIYSKHLQSPQKGKNNLLLKDPSYKKALEKKQRILTELNGVMVEMTQKAKEGIELTYPPTKSLENQPETE